MNTFKITATANTPTVLFAFDGSRAGAMIQNPFSAPIYLSRDPTAPMTSASIRVPAVNSRGDTGEYKFDGPCYEDWYFQTTGAGDFGVSTW